MAAVMAMAISQEHWNDALHHSWLAALILRKTETNAENFAERNTKLA